MGTIKKGILGGFSEKVGNVVDASWKSIAYIRSLPSSEESLDSSSREWWWE